MTSLTNQPWKDPFHLYSWVPICFSFNGQQGPPFPGLYVRKMFQQIWKSCSVVKMTDCRVFSSQPLFFAKCYTYTSPTPRLIPVFLNFFLFEQKSGNIYNKLSTQENTCGPRVMHLYKNRICILSLMSVYLLRPIFCCMFCLGCLTPPYLTSDTHTFENSEQSFCLVIFL